MSAAGRFVAALLCFGRHEPDAAGGADPVLGTALATTRLRSWPATQWLGFAMNILVKDRDQPMHNSFAKRCWFLLLGATLLLPAGCADGPLFYVVSLSPSRRQEWAADERYEPTLHRQLDEVHSVRDTAGSMTVAEQKHWAHEMKYLLETQQSPLLRAAAVDALAELAVPEADSGLALALKDKDPTVRIAACRAWAQHGGKQAIEHLAEMLGSDTNLDVRLAAAKALGRFKDPTAYEALGLALDDSDPALQYRAVESLKEASGRDFGNDLDAWRRLARGENPGPDTTPYLVRRLQRWF